MKSKIQQLKIKLEQGCDKWNTFETKGCGDSHYYCKICKSNLKIFNQTLKLIDDEIGKSREIIRGKVFKFALKEGGDKLHLNEVWDEAINELRQSISIKEDD